MLSRSVLSFIDTYLNISHIYVLKMVGAMISFFKKKNSNALIGIDFGSNYIKAIALSKKRGTYVIDAVAEIPIEKGLIVDGHFENIPKLISIIKQLRKNFPDSYYNVAIAVTGVDVITKTVKMNADLDDLELEFQVEIEAERSIPFPIDEIFLDFEVIGPSIDDPQFNDVLMSVARKENVISQVDCIEDAGLKTTIVDVESHAQARACELLFDLEDHEKGIVIIDIGSSKTMLNILCQGNIIFSRIKNYAGNACTELIAERYGLNFSDAEKAKKTNKLPAGCEEEVISLFIKQVIDNLRFDLRMFTNSPANIKLDKIILIGGGQLLNGFSSKIETELKIKVDVADPFRAFEYTNSSDEILLVSQGVRYIQALGLALRRLN